MSVIGQLHQLEDIEISLSEACRLLDGVNVSLQDRSAITRVEAELESQKQRLATVEREKRDAEAEIKDLEAKIASIRNKIEGGMVRNPKELTNLDKEIHALETQLREKDESTLSAMERSDELKQAVEQENSKLVEAQASIGRRKAELETQKVELEKRITLLQEQQIKMTATIPQDKLGLYKMLRKTLNGRVVVGVERGFCQGCRIALPLNEMRSLEHSETVRCSSCGRLLYMA